MVKGRDGTGFFAGRGRTDASRGFKEGWLGEGGNEGSWESEIEFFSRLSSFERRVGKGAVGLVRFDLEPAFRLDSGGALCCWIVD